MIALRNRLRSDTSVSCSIERPVMYEMYEGTSGRTQGETNDSSPAENAATNEIDCTESVILRPLQERFDQPLSCRRTPIAGAGNAIPNDALAIDEKCHRQLAGAILQPNSKIGVMQHGKRESHLLLKGAGDCCALGIS